MDLQTLLHNLHEEVSCSVCMSPFTDPKILPCFHTFCLHCDFLYKFGDEGKGDGEFNEPRYLSVDKEGHLMVRDSANDRVQVLELSGKFITKFKLMSGGLPTSTAVLSDGTIVVSNYSDSRIQTIK